MPPECGSKHPELPVTCELDFDHKGSHRRMLQSGTVEWDQVKVEKTYTPTQLLSMAEQQSDKLEITLDAAGNGSREADMIKTIVPIFQEQLFLIRQTLKVLEDKE